MKSMIAVLGVVLLLASQASAATYYVDALTGSDAAAGTEEAPFVSIAKAATAALLPGDRVVVRHGVYGDPIVVHGIGDCRDPIVFESETPGTAVITGQVQPAQWIGDNDDSAGSVTNHDITFKGFTFAGTTFEHQVRAGMGWTLENNLFSQGRTGINIRADFVTLRGNRFEDMQQHAFVGSGGKGIVIEGNIWQRINTAGTYNPADSAVTKLLLTTGLKVTNNISQDNVGPGLWLDFNNKDYVIAGNVIQRNRGRDMNWQGPGVWIELSDGGLVENNTFTDNEAAAVSILETGGVTVRNNVISGGYACWDFRNLDRGSPRYGIFNETITDNTCAMSEDNGLGFFRSDGVWDGWDRVEKNVVIDRNTYILTPLGAVAQWGDIVSVTREETCTQLGWECTP